MVTNETIKETIKLIKGLVMDLAYGEGEVDDFEAIHSIGEALSVIELEVESIENERNEYRRDALKTKLNLRKLEKEKAGE